MNWQEIEEKYPESLKKVTNFSFHDYFYDEEYGLPNEDRFLYDFFDEQNLFVAVFPTYYLDAWEYTINGEGKKNLGNIKRTEAEEIAFLKAFEILEEILEEKLKK